MIKGDCTLKQIKEYKEKLIKQDIYKTENIKKYKCCPYCGSTYFLKQGQYKGIQRYRCKNKKCSKTFSNTTCSMWKNLHEIFKNDVLKKVENGCYVHLYNFGGEIVEKQTMEYNKKLPKEVKKKFGFKIQNNWIGIPHITDSFQVSNTIKTYSAKVNSWIYRFRGIATKYVQHYYSFFSLINSINILGYMDLFWELLKNSNYMSVSDLKNTHIENY